jgi:sensor domain CHASE-containing protein
MSHQGAGFEKQVLKSGTSWLGIMTKNMATLQVAAPTIKRRQTEPMKSRFRNQPVRGIRLHFSVSILIVFVFHVSVRLVCARAPSGTRMVDRG